MDRFFASAYNFVFRCSWKPKDSDDQSVRPGSPIRFGKVGVFLLMSPGDFQEAHEAQQKTQPFKGLVS